MFSYAFGAIQAVGVVQAPYRECDRPIAFGETGEQWDKDGWLVQIDWSRLANPVSPKAHIREIAPLLPDKYSPLRPDGNGNQHIYLAAISPMLARVLLRLIRAGNPEVGEPETEARDDVAEQAELERIERADIPEPEKEQLVKARRGQGLFRLRLEGIERGCRLTNVRDKEMLVASHIKPWRDSTNAEKLDGENGLLLSPHVDKLFDRGWISFSDEGRILCAHDRARAVMRTWGLDPDAQVGQFTEKQKAYLAYHREHVYRGAMEIAGHAR